MATRFERARALLAAQGLGASGLAVHPDNAAPPGIRSLVLATAANPEAWRHFRESPESDDGRPDPLDRWSHRIIGAAAVELGGLAVFPDEGPPYWPFLGWSSRAEPVWSSPLGMFVHADFGLWYSCRGAIGFRNRIALPRRPAREKPCNRCESRPCLGACPVDAFAGGSFDAGRCRAWLQGESGRECRSGGCLARRACPVGDSFTHPPERAALHMEAFLRSAPTGSGSAGSGSGYSNKT